jgi:hypothetical protein
VSPVVLRGRSDELAAVLNAMQPAVAREEFRDELRVSRLRLMQGWLAAVEGDTGASLAILRPLVAAAANDIGAWHWSPPWMRTFAGIGLAANDDRFAQAPAGPTPSNGARQHQGSGNGEARVLGVRGTLTKDESRALAAWVVATGKNVTAIFVTHAHGDHFFGAPAVLERFPDAKVVAGHKRDGDADSPENIGTTRRYIEDFSAAVEKAHNVTDLYEAMVAVYPGRVNRAVIWHSAKAIASR